MCICVVIMLHKATHIHIPYCCCYKHYNNNNKVCVYVLPCGAL